MPHNKINKPLDIITLAQGNGGINSRQLIEDVFISAFATPENDKGNDAANIAGYPQMMMTTDGFTVDPLFFPGGDIGKLSVCGTINDLVVSGAKPKYMSCSFFIEEGFSKQDLIQIVNNMATTAKENEVRIVTGDTKILPLGNVSGVYISTTGVGRALSNNLNTSQIKAGDHIYVSGTIGDHGAAVMLAREDYGLSSNLKSDCASVLDIGLALMKNDKIKFMRDPTRGGIATICHEIIASTGLGITLDEAQIPIKPEVNTLCEILGLLPYYLACEGRILFVASPQWQVDDTLNNICNMTRIGIVENQHNNLLLKTQLGGLRFIPELDSDPLPRIC